MLSFFGLLAFLMAGLDMACRLVGWPLTTLAWSPVLFVVLGFVFVTLEAWERESGPAADGAAGQRRT